MTTASFARSLRTAFLVLLATNGCGSGGLGCGTLGPLAQPYPKDQLIEGGLQIRVTPGGFNKLKSVIPDVVNQATQGGICIGQISQSILTRPINVCYQRSCAGGAVGCRVPLEVTQLDMTVPNNGTLSINLTFNIGKPSDPVTVPIEADLGILGSPSCALDVILTNGRVNVDIAFTIDPTSGELVIQTQNIRNLDLSNLSISGCSVLGTILNGTIGFVTDLLNTQIGTFLANLLRPQIDAAIQNFLPKPLGLEGTADLGAALSGFAPGASGKMELRAVPGGYVGLRNMGLSLGLNLMLNSDIDDRSRSAALDSEPAFCVPARKAPDLASAPWNLGRTTRGTFKLDEAPEFSGAADPATDFAIGISNSVLDLGGHHVFGSGAMCLALGTRTLDALNAGSVGILVPSLLDLVDRNTKAPLLLVLRPMFPIDFKIGPGSDTDPHIMANVREMEVDFYGWINERYSRMFTMVLTLHAGVNLNFVMDASGKPALEPMLVGLDARQVTVKVLNSRLLAEDPALLERVLPDLLNIALPVIGASLKPFALPAISGFNLDNLRLAKVTTSQDDFLAIYTSLVRVTTGPMPLLPGPSQASAAPGCRRASRRPRSPA